MVERMSISIVVTIAMVVVSTVDVVVPCEHMTGLHLVDVTAIVNMAWCRVMNIARVDLRIDWRSVVRGSSFYRR